MATGMAESMYANVEDFYGFRAENEVNASLRARIAAALGYDPLSTALVPEEANIGEGCGNPLLIANLAEVDYTTSCAGESFSLLAALWKSANVCTLCAGRDGGGSWQRWRVRLLSRRPQSRSNR